MVRKLVAAAVVLLLLALVWKVALGDDDDGAEALETVDRID
jgi:hypothetical protein